MDWIKKGDKKMTKQEQIKEMAKVLSTVKRCEALALSECIKKKCEYPHYEGVTCIAEHQAETLYEQGYRKLPKDSVVLKIKEIEDTCNKCHWVTDYKLLKYHEEAVIKLCEQEVKQARKETAKEIFQRVINICRKEEDFQDGTVNTQLEPLYFGIMNGCAFVRGEVKELAKQYGVEVEE